ncbi:hypothetical protein CRYUN_Cryun01aG0139300 [Craigia yunnanensis]
MDGWVKQKLEKLVPEEIFNEVVVTATKRNFVSSQLPSIIEEDKYACFEEAEFGRQTLAGTNPVRNRRLLSSPQNEEFSPLSGTNQLPEDVLNAIKKAMLEERAFILDHYDYLLPFLNMINGKGVCAYATRTILVADSTLGTLEPLAIELRLPDPKSNMVFSPRDEYEWMLAYFHVAANDAAYHQLVSHWLHTHAVIEPFIIATRRQLSVMHPIHRLLDPHFKDTLHINALARGIFLNAGGILETTLFTEKEPQKINEDEYPVERDESQAEIDENVVELDENPATHKTPDKKERLLILEDYPYAKDGTEIWDAIEKWVREYCKIFYASDDDVMQDKEIQEWWSEIRN